jgi:hypothetical protein
MPHIHSLNQSSSAHILGDNCSFQKKEREAHAQSWLFLVILALYWKPILRKFLLGFLPHESFPG